MVNMKIEESLKDKSVIVSDISDDFLVQDILVNKELANKCINNGIIKNMFVGGNQQQG